MLEACPPLQTAPQAIAICVRRHTSNIQPFSGGQVCMLGAAHFGMCADISEKAIFISPQPPTHTAAPSEARKFTHTQLAAPDYHV